MRYQVRGYQVVLGWSIPLDRGERIVSVISSEPVPGLPDNLRLTVLVEIGED
jgi:hypothetical protein